MTNEELIALAREWANAAYQQAAAECAGSQRECEAAADEAISAEKAFTAAIDVKPVLYRYWQPSIKRWGYTEDPTMGEPLYAALSAQAAQPVAEPVAHDRPPVDEEMLEVLKRLAFLNRKERPMAKVWAQVEAVIARAASQPVSSPTTGGVPMTGGQIHNWWASENGMEDFDLCKFADFYEMVRAVEKKLGIPAPQGKED